MHSVSLSVVGVTDRGGGDAASTICYHYKPVIHDDDIYSGNIQTNVTYTIGELANLNAVWFVVFRYTYKPMTATWQQQPLGDFCYSPHTFWAFRLKCIAKSNTAINPFEEKLTDHSRVWVECEAGRMGHSCFHMRMHDGIKHRWLITLLTRNSLFPFLGHGYHSR